MKRKIIEIYPTQEQIDQIMVTTRACKAVRVFFINIYRECYNAERRIAVPTRNDLRKILTYLRKQEPIENMEFKPPRTRCVELQIPAEEYNVEIKKVINEAAKLFYEKNCVSISNPQELSELLLQASREAMETMINHLIEEYRKFFTRKEGQFANHPRYGRKKTGYTINRPDAVKIKKGKLFIPMLRYVEAAEQFAPETMIKMCKIEKKEGRYFVELVYNDDAVDNASDRSKKRLYKNKDNSNEKTTIKRETDKKINETKNAIPARGFQYPYCPIGKEYEIRVIPTIPLEQWNL
ncbi:hypothetical protein [uncultured Dubosiella sp.]|uniref:hypothetical protein n=1 Tax=uncultured Dubosiella sp. TaxID=1937011 RepID=UPI00272F2377|nr:hypothetical protein [uncultured Dubosiella sp.]